MGDKAGLADWGSLCRDPCRPVQVHATAQLAQALDGPHSVGVVLELHLLVLEGGLRCQIEDCLASLAGNHLGIEWHLTVFINNRLAFSPKSEFLTTGNPGCEHL